MCPGILPLPASGVAQGTTAGELNDYAGSCGGQSASDVVLGFVSEGPLESLVVSLEGSSYDNVLHVYRQDCGLSSMIGCIDDADLLGFDARLSLGPQPAGAYAIIVDGFDQEAGDFLLNVHGTIGVGEYCDPGKPFLRCAFGPCPSQGPSVCPAPLDCADGVDIDGDSMTDEDMCIDPPQLSCVALSGATPDIDTPVNVEAIATGGSPIVSRRWSVVDAPLGAFDPFPAERGAVASFIPVLTGRYRVRHTAVDALQQASLCELEIVPTVPAEFRIELVWNTHLASHENDTLLELQLLHPDAMTWFELDNACGSYNCPGLDWGDPGPENDPITVVFARPQVTEIAEAERGADYSIGVEYLQAGGAGLRDASLRILCNGVVEREIAFGDRLTNGTPGGGTNDFLKIANVSFSASNCQIEEIMQVVTVQQAASSR